MQGESYKDRSIKTYLAVSVLMIVGVILFYPTFRESLSAGVITLSSAVIWLGIAIPLILLLSSLPVLIRVKARKKETELISIREQAELYLRYQEETITEDLKEFSFLPPQPGEKFPTYKAPVNALKDPYAPRPKGYAKEQARNGYPDSPSLETLTEPTSAKFLYSQKVRAEEYSEFKKVLQSQGVTGSEAEIAHKFRQYKKFQELQAQTLLNMEPKV